MYAISEINLSIYLWVNVHIVWVYLRICLPHDFLQDNAYTRVLNNILQFATGHHCLPLTKVVATLWRKAEITLDIIQLLTKFGEDRMKFSGQKDRPTDPQSDSYIAPITNGV
ncbi:hypothetical protein DPMN_120202 [Dreissena polymorpha]|uniref:Uncharacterized protein n=1 Tax=Dreissena polymorpha TaxID=45954 RepID=A0A9D4JNB0_DREPO|nr:hypothetical protein DPMN_120202 [Dreissena polymorpha]